MRRTICLIGVCVAAALTAPAAHAGAWMQVSCVNPDGTPSTNQGWTASAYGPAGNGAASAACGPGVPLSAQMPNGLAAAGGEGELLTYAPPAGSTLIGGQLQAVVGADGHGVARRGVAAPAGFVGLYEPAFVDTAGTNDLFYGCSFADAPTPCRAATLDNASAVTDTLNTTFHLPPERGGDLYLTARCDGGLTARCDVDGSDGFVADVEVGSADLLLSNSSSPAGAQFSGSALKKDARGGAALVFDATDPGGPGVYTVSTAIDGVTVFSGTPDTAAGACVAHGADAATGALMFDYAQPCPQSVMVRAPVPTTKLPDGQHTLTASVTDAAGNSATVFDQRIATFNPQITPAPTRGLATRFVLSWRWSGPTTVLRSIAARKLPRGARITLTCRGRGCPGSAHDSVLAPSAGRLLSRLAASQYQAGDRLLFVVSAPHRRSERIRVRIRAGKKPVAQLLKHR
jgi:hypothetical protein